VVFLFLVQAKYKIGCGREGLAIMPLFLNKLQRWEAALKTYSNHKVSEVLDYCIHTYVGIKRHIAWFY